MVVRKAAIEDLPAIAQALGHFFPEAGFVGEFDSDHWVRAWSGLIHYDQGTMIVAEDGGEVAGALASIFMPSPLSGILTANEVMWYVRPEFRQGSLGLRLYRAHEREAQRRGVRVMIMTHLTGRGSHESMRKFYLREGYEQVEQIYRKDLWAT